MVRGDRGECERDGFQISAHASPPPKLDFKKGPEMKGLDRTYYSHWSVICGA